MTVEIPLESIIGVTIIISLLLGFIIGIVARRDGP